MCCFDFEDFEILVRFCTGRIQDLALIQRKKIPQYSKFIRTTLNDINNSFVKFCKYLLEQYKLK